MSLMVMNWDFALQAELSGWSSLQITRSFWGLGSFELRMSEQAPGAHALRIGNVIFFSDALHKAMLIEKLSLKDEQVTVSGKPVKGVAARRICVPPAIDSEYFGWDRFIGSAEAAYHHYAAANLYAPVDAKRKIERLEGAANQNRGITLPWQSRFGNLDALLLDIGEATEMGWDIVPDFQNKRYLFQVVEGRDLTEGMGKVVASAENRNAANIVITFDDTAAKTTAYVGGSGEDENRLIYSEGNETEGRERRETWVDAGSIFETEMLRAAARQKLDAATRKETMTAEVLDSGVTKYERDFDLGDRVILLRDGYQTHARLVEMRESYDSQGRKLQATFGSAPVTWARALRDTIWPIIR